MHLQAFYIWASVVSSFQELQSEIEHQEGSGRSREQNWQGTLVYFPLVLVITSKNTGIFWLWVVWFTVAPLGRFCYSQHKYASLPSRELGNYILWYVRFQVMDVHLVYGFQTPRCEESETLSTILSIHFSLQTTEYLQMLYIVSLQYYMVLPFDDLVPKSL